MNVWIELSESAFLNNIKNLQNVTNSSIGLVIKGNAYGHGLMEIIDIIIQNKLNYPLFLFNEDELVPIINKINYINNRIILLGTEIEEDFFVKYRLEYVIYSFETLNKIIKLSKKYNKIARVHLKFDTGMNRLGFKLSEAEKLINLIVDCNYIHLQGLMSHCYNNDYSGVASKEQKLLFDTIINKFEECNIKHESHIFASGSFDIENNYSMCRIGRSIYGFGYSNGNEKRIKEKYKNFELKQVLTLKCRLLQIKDVSIGDYIGYGSSNIAEKEMKIGIISFGYADGFFINLDNSELYFCINGQIGKIICINMNSSIIDLTNIINVSYVHEVIIFSDKYENIKIQNISNKLKISPSSITSILKDNIKKIVIK